MATISIAGHGDDLVVGLQGRDQAQLVLRAGAGVNVGFQDHLA